MKFIRFFFITVLLTLIGCANWQKPSQEKLTLLPIVTFGESIPSDKDFILYFPAGKPIPTDVSIQGNIFENNAEEILTVTLKKDIYVYKNWVSFDRNTWLKGEDAIDFILNIQIPGYDHPKPGYIKIKMDEQNNQ